MTIQIINDPAAEIARLKALERAAWPAPAAEPVKVKPWPAPAAEPVKVKPWPAPAAEPAKFKKRAPIFWRPLGTEEEAEPAPAVVFSGIPAAELSAAVAVLAALLAVALLVD